MIHREAGSHHHRTSDTPPPACLKTGRFRRCRRVRRLHPDSAPRQRRHRLALGPPMAGIIFTGKGRRWERPAADAGELGHQPRGPHPAPHRRSGGRRHRSEITLLLMFSGLAPTRMASSDDDGQTGCSDRTFEPIGDSSAVERSWPWPPIRLQVRDDGTSWCRVVSRRRPPIGVGPRLAMPQNNEVSYNPWSKQVFQRDGFHIVVPRWKAKMACAGAFPGHVPAPLPPSHRAGHDLCEPRFGEEPSDGKTWALLMRENSRQHNGSVIFSTDAGRTWSHPQ